LNGLTQAPIPGAAEQRTPVLVPEQVVAGERPAGNSVLIYDTDGYFIAASLAELLALDGLAVTYATPHDALAPYLRMTLEEPRMHRRLTELGVEILPQTTLAEVLDGEVELRHAWSGASTFRGVDAVVPVTQRRSRAELFDGLAEDPERLTSAGIRGLFLIGDACSPGMIAQSVFDGHRLAREIDSDDPSAPLPYIRERRLLDATEADFAP
jgi:dimethylamine/trimethylamine dehydrogenase